MERKGKTRIRRKNGGVKKVIMWLIILILVVQVFIRIVVPASVTFSRYVYKAVRSYYFASKAFYFNSDKLSEDTAVFEANNWSGAEIYSVTVNMNSRKSIEEVCETNVNYTLKYTCKVCKSSGEEYTEDLVDFVIDGITEEEYDPNVGISKTIFHGEGANNTSSFDFSVDLKENLENGDYVYVTITAESTYPYKKTLVGTFKIEIGNPGMSYQIEDSEYSPYLSVIVTNTLDYYTVEEAFDSYNVGDTLSIAEYSNLTDTNKEKCYSMKVEATFDPEIVVMDTTSAEYINAVAENNVKYEEIEGEDGNLYNYVNYIQLEMGAEESKVIKFYKVVAANDYTYPKSNSQDAPVVLVKDIKESTDNG